MKVAGWVLFVVGVLLVLHGPFMPVWSHWEDWPILGSFIGALVLFLIASIRGRRATSGARSSQGTGKHTAPMSEFIEFSVASSERFSALQRVFAELKHDKDANDWRNIDAWLKCFDSQSLSHFCLPTQDERQQWSEALRNRPKIETSTR